MDRSATAQKQATAVRTDEVRKPAAATVDQKLEVVILPVSDVDRATQFYLRLGWRQDVTPPGSGVVLLTPHGSSCSVQFGAKLTSAAPGSGKGYLIVSDIVGARNKLVDAGIEVSEIFHLRTARPAVRIRSAAATALSLKPGLIIHSIYNGYWFWGRPSLADLWLDLRYVTSEIRPDWDSAHLDFARPGTRAAAPSSTGGASGPPSKQVLPEEMKNGDRQCNLNAQTLVS